MNTQTRLNRFRTALASAALVACIINPAFASDALAELGQQALHEIREQTRRDLHQSLRSPAEAASLACAGHDSEAPIRPDGEIGLNTDAYGSLRAYHPRHG